MIRPLADYTHAVSLLGHGRDVVEPTIAIASPKHSEHCWKIAQLIATSLARSGEIIVINHQLSELDSVHAPWLKYPPLDNTTRLAVERFTAEFDEWEAGTRQAMPDPRTVGGTMSPYDYVQRADVGQRIIAGMTGAHVALQVLTSTGVYLANAVLGPSAEEALATGIFPATPTPYGAAHIYEYPAGEYQPVQLTAEPVRLRHLVPPQIMPPLQLPHNDISSLPIV